MKVRTAKRGSLLGMACTWLTGATAAICLVLLGAALAHAGYVDNGDGTVTDTRTGLMWQQGDGQNSRTTYSWIGALSYCEALTLAGYDDWRLPNVRELHSLVDVSRYNPALNTAFFRSGLAHDYWTSTTYADTSGHDRAWDVNFYDGRVETNRKSNENYVRCVRAGPGALGPLTIAQTPMSGPPGTTFTQWGTGFTPNGTATLHFRKPYGTEYPTKIQQIDSQGRFEITYTAPLDKSPGTYTWWAIDDATGRKSNEVSYTILGQIGKVDHFVFSHIDDQLAGVFFLVTLTAVDYTGNKVTSFSGEVSLDLLSSSCVISPNKVTLTKGEATFGVTIDKAFRGISIYASAPGLGGTSNAFDVIDYNAEPGRVDVVVRVGSGAGISRSGATVILTEDSGNEFGRCTTDTYGACSINAIPAGNYKIHAEYEDMKSPCNSVPVAAGITSHRVLILRSRKRPVILVPGVMGSDMHGAKFSPYPTLPREMPAPQTGLNLHNPYLAAGWYGLKRKLKEHYQTFDCPYDWRLSLRDKYFGRKAYEIYLVHLITQAKEATGWDKVDVVAHSMGGLLTRAYIQSEDYDNDIDKFVMVGTPNHGSLNAYEIWEGGDPILADQIHGSISDGAPYFYAHVTDNIYSLYHDEGLVIWQHDSDNPHYRVSRLDIRKFLEEHVPSVRELLPTFDFLIENHYTKFISNEKDRNQFLIDLNADLGKLKNKGIKIAIFGSDGEETSIYTKVRESAAQGLYEDGQPIGYMRIADGDGTVLWHSAMLDGVDSNPDRKGGAHSGLIGKFAQRIVQFLDKDRDFRAIPDQSTAAAGRQDFTDETPQWGVSIRLIGRAGVYLADPGGLRCGVDDDAGTSYDEPAQCTAVRDPGGGGISIGEGPGGVYRIHLSGTVTERVRMFISAIDGDHAEDRTVNLHYPGTPIEFTFRFTHGGDPLVELLPEIEAPKDLASLPYDAADPKTKLTWSAVADPGLAGYRIYVRREDEPNMSRVAVVGADVNQYETADTWDEPLRFYAVSSIDKAGHESPLSELVDNRSHLVAHIGASDVEGEAPHTVHFTDQSTGTVTVRQWDFGDGTTGSAASMDHTYTSVGHYMVILKVSGPDNVDQATKEINVVPNADQMKRANSRRVVGNQTWQTVDFGNVYYDPVVIVGPPTYNGTDPGVIRVRNVNGSGFDLRFQEWSYLDGSHMSEQYPYLVLEKGRRTMDDGSIWEAGTFVLDGTRKWTGVNFSEAFAGQPALFLTMQTYNGSDPVTVRARNVTTEGFEAALFEEEAKMDGHVGEVVGYLAIYNPQRWGTVNMNGTQTPYLLQQVTAGNVFTPVLSYSLKVEEEKSKDSETYHMDETLSVLVLGDKLFAQDITTNGGDPCALRVIRPEYSEALEWGTVDGVDHNWLRVPLAKEFTHPVIVAKPVSYRGADPGVIRLRNVTGKAFDLRFQEWLCKDGWHLGERVFYLVAEEGIQHVGVKAYEVRAGTVNTSKLMKNGWEAVNFTGGFNAPIPPAVFTSVETYNGIDPVITRIRDVTLSGFEVTMDEEEAKRDGHVTETVGWIALAWMQLPLGGSHLLQIMGPYQVDSNPTSIDLLFTVQRRFPVLIANMQTTNGGDPCVVRYQNLTPSSVDLFLQEEPSRDAEMNHVVEDVGILEAE